jgi:hypothetical protein
VHGFSRGEYFPEAGFGGDLVIGDRGQGELWFEDFWGWLVGVWPRVDLQHAL